MNELLPHFGNGKTLVYYAVTHRQNWPSTACHLPQLFTFRVSRLYYIHFGWTVGLLIPPDYTMKQITSLYKFEICFVAQFGGINSSPIPCIRVKLWWDTNSHIMSAQVSAIQYWLEHAERNCCVKFCSRVLGELCLGAALGILSILLSALKVAWMLVFLHRHGTWKFSLVIRSSTQN